MLSSTSVRRTFHLSALDCSRRIGVEWGDAARSVAADRGIEVFQWSAEVPPSSVDIVISNHALEHAHRPLDELRELARVLVEDGELVLVVPLDDWRKQRRPDTTDPNHHLYGWTPLLLANLCTEAGFRVRDCRILAHAWRPGFVAAQRRLPRRAYRLLTLLYSVVLRRRQIKIVCEKRRVRPQPEEYARRRARSHAIPYS